MTIGGRKQRAYKCRPCNRKRLAAVRNKPVTTPTVPLEGARERLARFLDEHWDLALPRLVELMNGWTTPYTHATNR